MKKLFAFCLLVTISFSLQAQIAPTVQQFTTLYRSNKEIFQSLLEKRGFEKSGNRFDNVNSGESIFYKDGSELMYTTKSSSKQAAIISQFHKQYRMTSVAGSNTLFNFFKGTGDIQQSPVLYSNGDAQKLFTGSVRSYSNDKLYYFIVFYNL